MSTHTRIPPAPTGNVAQALDGWIRTCASAVVAGMLDVEHDTIQSIRRELLAAESQARSADDDNEALRGAITAFVSLVDAWGRVNQIEEDAEGLLRQPTSVVVRLLRAVAGGHSRSQKELAEEVETAPAVVSRYGRDLELNGLIVRRRAGKERHWELSPRGRRVVTLIDRSANASP